MPKKSLTLKKAVYLPLHEVEQLSENEKEEYFSLLRKYCTKLGMKYGQQITLTQRAIARFGIFSERFLLRSSEQKICPKAPAW